MFIKFIIFSLLLKPHILLFPGLGVSRLIKDNVDIWLPKLSFFIFCHNRWINTIIHDKELKT